MKSLANDNITDEFLRVCFLKRLPQIARLILKANNEPLDDLARTADTLLDNIGNTSIPYASINAIATPGPKVNEFTPFFDAINTKLSLLQTSVTDLANRVSALEIQKTPPSYRESRGRDRSPSLYPHQRAYSKPRSLVPNGLPICYFHYNFGANARNCKPLESGAPCSFKKLQEN